MALRAVTLRTVQALKPGTTIWDADHREAVKGFGVRRQRGTPVYVIKYRVFGLQRFVTIGTHGSPWTPDTARREAKRLFGLVANGKDPQAEKIEARAEAADTLGRVAIDYLKTAKKSQKARSYAETERHLLVNWKPLHPVSVFHLRRRQVAARLAEIEAERGTVTAARARAALSAMFNWAIREGFEITANPVVGTNRPHEPRSRQRVLTDGELLEIWSACRDDDHGHIVKLLTLTAQRRDEVGGVRRSEVDISKKLWTIPESPRRTIASTWCPCPVPLQHSFRPRCSAPIAIMFLVMDRAGMVTNSVAFRVGRRQRQRLINEFSKYAKRPTARPSPCLGACMTSEGLLQPLWPISLACCRISLKLS